MLVILYKLINIARDGIYASLYRQQFLGQQTEQTKEGVEACLS